MAHFISRYTADDDYTVREELDDVDRADAADDDEHDHDRMSDDGCPNDRQSQLDLMSMCVDVQRSTETIAQYAQRLLAFILSTRLTGNLTDEQLELAQHFAIYAVAGHDISSTAVDTIVSVQHQISHALRVRALDAASTSTGALLAQSTSNPKPNIGPMAPLSPVPQHNPPSGSYADVRF